MTINKYVELDVSFEDTTKARMAARVTIQVTIFVTSSGSTATNKLQVDDTDRQGKTGFSQELGMSVVGENIFVLSSRDYHQRPALSKDIKTILIPSQPICEA